MRTIYFQGQDISTEVPEPRKTDKPVSECLNPIHIAEGLLVRLIVLADLLLHPL